MPGQDVGQYVKSLKEWLRKARPEISDKDCIFFVEQKLLSSLPPQIASLIRLFPNISLDEMIQKSRQLLADSKLSTPSTQILSVNEMPIQNQEKLKEPFTLEGLKQELDELKSIMAIPVEKRNLSRQDRLPCKKCGLRSHETKDCWGTVVCNKCKRTGHAASICRSNRNFYISKSGFCNRYYSFSISNSNNKCFSYLYVKNLEQKICCLVDTGACVSLINENVVFGLKYYPSNITLAYADGEPVKPAGEIRLGIRIENLTTDWTFVVVNNLMYDAIIGQDILQEYKAIIDFENNFKLKFAENFIKPCDLINTINMCHPSYDNIEEYLFSKYPGVKSNGFMDNGLTNLTSHTIKLTSNKAIKVKPYRISIHLADVMEKQISEMLSSKVIRPSNSPYASPCILVAKKGGDHRLCVDFRKLNEITIRDEYPLPSIDWIIDNMHGARYFTTLDLKSGYWQVPMNEDSKYLTAFSPGPGLGHYEFNVMPFGLTNAPSTFQRLMDAVLKDLNCAIAYLDDVVIFSPNSEQHLKDIEAVLNRFENHGLKINQRKCKFFAQEIEYLGYIVSKEGIKPNTQSLDALKKWQTPDNTKKLQQFLGTCNYYSRFLKNYSKIAFPLYRLLRKGVTWLWDEDCQNKINLCVCALDKKYT
ncbi:Retrovirus-related Pol polyprotein [Thelohanellus kitauei]|uniref:Retrovirus-related Pol polyprotein n=1 Tax=Thelohanellus kitauei TaxID=669202 RepID=A0A0C2MBD4_THEKT|nr:Retrovirus-related Pol polyprotein [Thelohanellus kitauei]